MDIVIDYGVGTYDLDVRATFESEGETYGEVLVFRNFAVTYQVSDGVRVGTHQSLEDRREYRDFIKYLASVSQKMDECDCDKHEAISSTMEFFVRGQDV